MRRMSSELSFLRQSYICAPALSAGQVDGIKFRSRESDETFPLIPPFYRLSRSRENRIYFLHRTGQLREWSGRKISHSLARIVRHEFLARNQRDKEIPNGVIDFAIAFRSLYRPAADASRRVARIKVPCGNGLYICIEKRYIRKHPCNFVTLSFPRDISCVRIHAAPAFHVREEWRSMSEQLTDADLFIFSIHLTEIWSRFDGRYWQTRYDEGFGNRSMSSACPNSGWLFSNAPCCLGYSSIVAWEKSKREQILIYRSSHEILVIV